MGISISFVDEGRPPVTLEEQVFAELRTAILAGKLAPGRRLSVRALAESCGVSALPVRAALSRLRAEGLVMHVAHSGSRVAPLEFERFQEIQAERMGLEGLAAALSVPRLTEEDI